MAQKREEIYSFRRVESKKNKPLFLAWLREIDLFSLFGGVKLNMTKVSKMEIVLSFLGILMGRSVILGELMPFGIAFLGAGAILLGRTSLPVFIGVAIGLMAHPVSIGLYGSLAAVGVLFVIMQTWYKAGKKSLGLALLAGATVVTVKVGVFLLFQQPPYYYMVAIIEGMLAGLLLLILIYAYRATSKIVQGQTMVPEEMGALVISSMALLSGLSGIDLAGISLRGVLSRAVIMVAALGGGPGVGAAVGAAMGSLPSLLGIFLPALVGIYALAGLTAGLFRSFGRLGTIIGFALANLLLTFYYTDWTGLIASLQETVLGAVLYLVVTHYWRITLPVALQKHFIKKKGKGRDRKVIEVTSHRIQEFSRVFAELSLTFEGMTNEVQDVEKEGMSTLLKQVAGKVCVECSVQEKCWERDFYKTYKGLLDLFTLAELNGGVLPTQLSIDLYRKCLRKKDLAMAVNCLVEAYRMSHVWHKKLQDSREIVSGQLRGVSQIMDNLARELKLDVQVDDEIENVLRKNMSKAGLGYQDLTVIDHPNGQREITIKQKGCTGSMDCMTMVAPMVTGILGQKMSVVQHSCTLQNGENPCEYCLIPTCSYHLNTGVARVAKGGVGVCGDSYTTFELKEGRMALLLSDGMGSGNKAAAESKATIALLTKLLESGFAQDLAVKTVNSVLLLRSKEETFATVDLAVIDLYTGGADFVKIGAVPSYIKRGPFLHRIKSMSPPIGILAQIEVDTFHYKLNAGDILIMATDGILEAKSSEECWLEAYLEQTETRDAQKLADAILNKALRYSKGEARDDMTILVAQIEANPLSNQENLHNYANIG